MSLNKLLYWSYPNGIRFSKTKFFSIILFVFVLVSRIYYTSNLTVSVLVALTAAIIAFIIGYIIHKIMKNNNVGSEGLIKDIIRLLFYWRQGKGFRMSVTKLGSIFVFIALLSVYCLYYGIGDILAGTGVSLFLAVILFIIGYFLHVKNTEG